MSYNYIIIDENQQHATTVEQHLSKDKAFIFQDTFNTLEKAKDFVQLQSVDVIIMDPNFKQGSAKKFIQKLPQTTKVILHSGRQKDAVNGFEWGVFDFLPKPFKPDRWAITKYRLNNLRYQKEKGLLGLPDNYIEVRCNLMNERILHDNIQYIEAMGDYIRIVTSRKKFVVLMSMKKVESLLPKESFFRIHKSYIINLTKVTQYKGQEVAMGALKFPLSRFKKEAFKMQLTRV